jgi:hypothetical protein
VCIAPNQADELLGRWWLRNSDKLKRPLWSRRYRLCFPLTIWFRWSGNEVQRLQGRMTIRLNLFLILTWNASVPANSGKVKFPYCSTKHCAPCRYLFSVWLVHHKLTRPSLSVCLPVMNTLIEWWCLKMEKILNLPTMVVESVGYFVPNNSTYSTVVKGAIFIKWINKSNFWI